MICLKLAKAGWGAGDPQKIAEMRVDWVKKIIDYETYCDDYCVEDIKLNTPTK